MTGSCLCGSASLVTILQSGNGVKNKFATPKGGAAGADGVDDQGRDTVQELLMDGVWDWVVINDQTQAAARMTPRNKSKKKAHCRPNSTKCLTKGTSY